MSDSAKAIGWGLRQSVGVDAKGVGPDTPQLLKLFPSVEPAALRAAVDELEEMGLVHVQRAIGIAIDGIPREFRGIVGVLVTEDMQVYFDDLGL